MEKLLNEEYAEVDCFEVIGSCCLITEEEVAAAIKGLLILKTDGPTDVLNEMMKASDGHCIRSD